MKPYALALCLLIALGPGASAADAVVPTVIQDTAGDANFINDSREYSFGDRPSDQSDPVLDVRRVTLSPTYDDDRVDGFLAQLTLEAAPEARTYAEIKSRTQRCADIYFIYQHRPEGAGQVTFHGDCNRRVRVPLTTTVTGSTITFHVPFRLLPAVVLEDNHLTTVNAGTSLTTHLAPGLLVHTGSADTTLTRARYRLR
jgi:hypothetical protein